MHVHTNWHSISRTCHIPSKLVCMYIQIGTLLLVVPHGKLVCMYVQIESILVPLANEQFCHIYLYCMDEGCTSLI